MNRNPPIQALITIAVATSAGGESVLEVSIAPPIAGVQSGAQEVSKEDPLSSKKVISILSKAENGPNGSHIDTYMAKSSSSKSKGGIGK
jgi:hypothetical protein